jgi:predicted deacylase
VNDSPIVCTVGYERTGKQFGWLQAPRSTNESATSHPFISTVCIVNTGPAVLVTVGGHGGGSAAREGSMT